MALGDFFSGGGSQSQNDSYSGLRGLQRKDGTFYVQDLASRMPGDYDFLVNNLRQQAASPFDIGEMGQLNHMGLTNSQMGAFNTAVNSVANRFSQGLASRGQVSPANVDAIAGSAAQNAAPGFLDIIQQNMMNKVMLPEQVKQNRFAQLNNAMGLGQGMLGNESHGTATQRGPGIGYTFGNELAGSLGKSLGQWAAPGGAFAGAS